MSMKTMKKGNNWTAYYDPDNERYFAEIIYKSREGTVAACTLFRHEREGGKKYASEAIDEMNRMAKKDGCKSSALFAGEHNLAGLKLYEKLGYTFFNQGDGGVFLIKTI